MVLLSCATAKADTFTNRAGLTQPTTSFGDIWGVKFNNNMALIDSSFAGLSLYNNFITTNTFNGDTYFPKISPGSNMTVDSTGKLIGQANGGGGTSSLQVMVGSVVISTPTGNLQFNSNFRGSLAGSATAQIDLNPGTTYFIQNSTIAQTANFNVTQGTATTFFANTATIGTGLYTNATISGPTLGYSTGTFLNSIAIGTINANGQPFRMLDTNGSGIATFESPNGITLHWLLENNTSGASPNLDIAILGVSGDAPSGAVAFDAIIRAANNLYLSAGGPTAPGQVRVSASGVSISTESVSSMTVTNITINGTCTGSGCGSGGGGGSSVLAVTTGTLSGFSTAISSPTRVLNLNGQQFGVQLASPATGYVSILSTQTFSSMTVTGNLTAGTVYTSKVSNDPGTSIVFEVHEGPSPENILTLLSNYPNADIWRSAQNLSIQESPSLGSQFNSTGIDELGGASHGWAIANGVAARDTGLSLVPGDNTHQSFINFQSSDPSDANGATLWYQPLNNMGAFDRSFNFRKNLIVGSTQTAGSAAFTYPQSSQFQIIGSTTNTYEIRMSTWAGGYDFAISTQGEMGLNNSYGTAGQVSTSQGPGLPAHWAGISGGSSALGVNFNGTSITTPTAQINFVGAGVSVSAIGSTATVTIAGGGGGAATFTDQLLPCNVTNPTSSTLVFASSATSTHPCTVHFGEQTYQFVSSSTLTLGASTGTAHIYITNGSDSAGAGTLQAAWSAGSGLTGSGFAVQNNNSQNALGSIPIALWNATVSGTWDSTGSNIASVYGGEKQIIAGSGITKTETGTSITIGFSGIVVTSTSSAFALIASTSANLTNPLISVSTTGVTTLNGAVQVSSSTYLIQVSSSNLAPWTTGFTLDTFYILRSSGSIILAGSLAASSATFTTSNLNVQISSNGYVGSTGGSAPTFSGCGTSPTVTAGSNNMRGSVTMTSGLSSSCTIIPATPAPSNYFCTISGGGAGTAVFFQQSANLTAACDNATGLVTCGVGTFMSWICSGTN